jgi:hypothetical protein
MFSNFVNNTFVASLCQALEPSFLSEVSARENLCYGCCANLANQQAHMDPPHGCLVDKEFWKEIFGAGM